MRFNHPADSAAAVTPSDSVDLTTPTRGLMATVAGTVKVDMSSSGQVTLTFVAGVVYPLQVKRVYSTGTTATGITALW